MEQLGNAIRRLHATVRRLPPAAEISIVIVVAFGWFCVESVAWAIERIEQPGPHLLDVWGVVAYECVALPVLSWFLFVRGWRPVDIGLLPTWKSTAVGVGVAVMAYVAYLITFVISALIWPGSWSSGEVEPVVIGRVSFGGILLIASINGLYEELFVAGYLISVFKKRRAVILGVSLSVAIRTIYHLYQGIEGVVSILPFGLLLAYWYTRTSRLWPLIVVHFVFDAVGLWVASR